MSFHLHPILETMIALYEQPASMERFNKYIALLQGNTKGDMVVPIGGYNPMGKEHVLQKLLELKKLNAESVAAEVLEKINGKIGNRNQPDFKVVLNLSDDLKGGWTNRYTSDYDSKFRIHALITRNFCTPVFWSGEEYTVEQIAVRVAEYCFRTIYRATHAQPESLRDHVEQEVSVFQSVSGLFPDARAESLPATAYPTLHAYYQQHQDSTDYLTIFNFFYGDEASVSLGHVTRGIEIAFAGYKYAASVKMRTGI
ncbi:MAG TPA: hypothetical protein VK826_20885 [Bacteroidia bacterium]|nr:hypothetical protein [Bacteroidia bacterium]